MTLITNMKFYQQINKYMEEADIERLAKQDSREEYDDELDKKEAYKASLMRSDEPEDEIDPLEDPFWQHALEVLDGLLAKNPSKFQQGFAKFSQRVDDVIQYRKGVSL